MSIFDDPALRLRAPARLASMAAGHRVSFKSDSHFARDLGIPAGASGAITARYADVGRELLNIAVDGVGYCTGVPAAEIIEHDGNEAHA